MLATLRFPELRLTRPLAPMGCDGLWPSGCSTERLAMTGGWVSSGYPTVDSCCLSVRSFVRSWRLGWLADGGTELAATTYSLTIAEPPDTEYELASVPRNVRSAGLRRLNDPNFPRQKRHHTVNLRPSRAKREPPRPGKRLM